MSVAQNRLSFIAENRDLGWISMKTGIGVPQLDSLAETGGVLSRGDDLALRRIYQQEAYDRMRAVGFSSAQADRFRWFAAKSVKEREQAVRDKVEYLGQGAFVAIKAKLDQAGETYDETLLKQQAYGSVWLGFRNSKLPYESWMEYP